LVLVLGLAQLINIHHMTRLLGLLCFVLVDCGHAFKLKKNKRKSHE
jgi:hypothetical protein